MGRSYIFDAELQLKDAGLVAADAAAQVGGNAQVLDVGDARFTGELVVDVSAIEVASNDELYEIILEGSTTEAFSGGEQRELVVLRLGANEVLPRGSADSTTGRYAVPFTNEPNPGGTTFRYLRAYTNVSGTIATGINYLAYLSKTKI